MRLTLRLTAGLLIAVIAATITATLRTGTLIDLPLLAAFIVACIACVLVGSRTPAGPRPLPRHSTRPARDANDAGATQGGQRETGQVKWFNVAKGFGFIVRDSGEEIFVHFRSIRGSGRRALRDGQRVSFVVGETAKGPQAEDVQAEPQE